MNPFGLLWYAADAGLMVVGLFVLWIVIGYLAVLMLAGVRHGWAARHPSGDASAAADAGSGRRLQVLAAIAASTPARAEQAPRCG